MSSQSLQWLPPQPSVISLFMAKLGEAWEGKTVRRIFGDVVSLLSTILGCQVTLKVVTPKT